MSETCFCGEGVVDPPCSCPQLKEAQHLIVGYKYLLRRARRELPSATPLRGVLDKMFEEGEVK